MAETKVVIKKVRPNPVYRKKTLRKMLRKIARMRQQETQEVLDQIKGE